MGGFSLLEFLVGLTILSLGLTGLAALHNRTLQSLQDSAHQQRALILATDMAERMAANTVAAAASQYTLTPRSRTRAIDCAAGCAPFQLAQADLAQWRHNITTLLPSGEGAVVRNGDIYQITVLWKSVVTERAGACPDITASRAHACVRLEVAL